MFRSKSSDKSKEARGSLSSAPAKTALQLMRGRSILDAKANGNVFGVALAQCVLDDDYRCQDETNTASSPTGTNATASEIYRKDSSEMINNDKRTSPSGSVSSTNDSGYSVSPASPSSLHVRRNHSSPASNSTWLFRSRIPSTSNRNCGQPRSKHWRRTRLALFSADATR